MRKLVGILILVLGLSQVAVAAVRSGNDMAYENLDRVGQFSLLSGLYGWNIVDDDSIIVWASPFRPFLIDLSRKSRGLRFVNRIGVTSTAGHVYEKFDSVIIDGIRYPIQDIYRLDRESAKRLQRHS